MNARRTAIAALRRATISSEAALLILSTVSLACSNDDSSVEASLGNTKDLAQEAPSLPVDASQGNWRFTPFGELGRTAVWLSHILIRHADAEPSAVPFAPRWHVQPPPVPRTRDEARELALSIRRWAEAGVERFDALARAQSEDVSTAQLGGELGPVAASVFESYPQILDQLVAMRPGALSSLVETRYGFHIFVRRQPPEPILMSGRHIVIGYRDATWLEYLKRQPQRPMRDRSTAQQIASEVARQANVAPEAFDQLVSQYSEHRDADESFGDIGVWRLGEPTPMRREMQVLATLKVGEASAPIDTFLGFVIIQRTEVTNREPFAMSFVRFSFPSVGDASDANARSDAFDRAHDLLALLKAPDGEQHERQLQKIAWLDGRGPHNLTAALRSVSIGDLMPEPVLSDNSYIVGRRLPATPASVPAALAEVPRPLSADIEYWLPRLVEKELPALKQQTLPAMRDAFRAALLTDNESAQALYDQVHERLSDAWKVQRKEDRLVAVANALAEIRALIGSAAYGAYVDAIKRFLATHLTKRSPTLQGP
jgi:hypothetical protein